MNLPCDDGDNRHEEVGASYAEAVGLPEVSATCSMDRLARHNSTLADMYRDPLDAQSSGAGCKQARVIGFRDGAVLVHYMRNAKQGITVLCPKETCHAKDGRLVSSVWSSYKKGDLVLVRVCARQNHRAMHPTTNIAYTCSLLCPYNAALYSTGHVLTVDHHWVTVATDQWAQLKLPKQYTASDHHTQWKPGQSICIRGLFVPTGEREEADFVLLNGVVIEDRPIRAVQLQYPRSTVHSTNQQSTSTSNLVPLRTPETVRRVQMPAPIRSQTAPSASAHASCVSSLSFIQPDSVQDQDQPTSSPSSLVDSKNRLDPVTPTVVTRTVIDPAQSSDQADHNSSISADPPIDNNGQYQHQQSIESEEKETDWSAELLMELDMEMENRAAADQSAIDTDGQSANQHIALAQVQSHSSNDEHSRNRLDRPVSGCSQLAPSYGHAIVQSPSSTIQSAASVNNQSVAVQLQNGQVENMAQSQAREQLMLTVMNDPELGVFVMQRYPQLVQRAFTFT